MTRQCLAGFLLPFLILISFSVSTEAGAKEPPAPLTLHDCLRLALEANRSILSSRTRVTAAKAKARQIGITQLPAAAISAQDTRLREPNSSSTGLFQDFQRVTVSENLNPFGKNRSQRQAANATLRATEAEVDRTVLETGFNVTRAFYDLLLADEFIGVASESLDQLARHRDDTEKRVRAGSAPKFDLVRSEVQLSAAKPILLRAVRNRESALVDLLHLIGRNPDEDVSVLGSFPDSIPDIPREEERAVTIATMNRPDLAAALASQDAARSQKEAARRNLQPGLTFSGIYERTRGTRVPATRYRDNWNLIMGLQFPLFDSGMTRELVREAGANLDQARINVDNTLSQLRVDIRKALLTLEESEEVLSSQEKNVALASEALSIAHAAYATGSKTSLDVLDAQLALAQARNTLSQARRDRVVAVALLQRALGMKDAFNPGEEPPKTAEEKGTSR